MLNGRRDPFLMGVFVLSLFRYAIIKTLLARDFSQAVLGYNLHCIRDTMRLSVLSSD